ncbi:MULTISPECIES: sodium-dependent transporter [Salinicola]|jgi:NSS family neurotransmitter:Na+ symporter|uniref:sodium-dependent transporter n=1 Tax=Salinicola TaxID=404432 RepID=UPI0008DD873E|nr:MULTISPECIES: sodium-dependent transporter [Salinicola]OHZ00099.1 transporter [Salinicola sp. MIT1003]
MTAIASPKNLWLGRWGFVLAATGSSVGLGNIWKFPYMTGEYGGGAFVMVYLLCIAAIGVPVMMTEIALGRRGRGSPIDAIRRVARESGRSGLWSGLGWMAMLCGFMILSFYVVVAGWAVSYLWKSLSGGLSADSVEGMAAIFGANNANPWNLGFWSTLVTLATMAIVGLGVQAGIERSVRWMMPGLVIMLVIMIVYAFFSGSFGAGVHFLFAFDPGKLTGQAVLAAMGHAFFTLSLASGAILTYGAYLPAGQSIGRTTLMVAICDTLVALMAGLAIFPVIFANGMDPASGPGLIFMSLPLAFQQMPLGGVIETIFFLMLTVAALTSAISMIEATVAWLNESHGISRARAAWGVGILLWVVSTLAMLSFNVGADWKLAGRHFFDWLDFLTSRFLMPLGGLGTALLAGFVLRRESLEEELGLPSAVHALWRFAIRYVCPLAIVVVFLDALGALGAGFDWRWIAAILALALVGEIVLGRAMRRA